MTERLADLERRFALLEGDMPPRVSRAWRHAAIAYREHLDGRLEMALAAVDHLSVRGTLGGEEIAEIRTHLLDLVTALPLGRAAAAGHRPDPPADIGWHA